LLSRVSERGSVMTNPTSKPMGLTLPDHLQKAVQDNIRDCNDIATLIPLVESCGVNCDHWEALRQRLLEINNNAHQHFCGPPKIPV
jgi:hypothetical protein